MMKDVPLAVGMVPEATRAVAEVTLLVADVTGLAVVLTEVVIVGVGAFEVVLLVFGVLFQVSTSASDRRKATYIGGADEAAPGRH